MAALPNDFESLEEAFGPSGEPADELSDRLSHYPRLADIALLDAARKEQRRIKERIRSSVENYRRLTGKKR